MLYTHHTTTPSSARRFVYFITKGFFVEASHQVRRPSPSFLAKPGLGVCV